MWMDSQALGIYIAGLELVEGIQLHIPKEIDEQLLWECKNVYNSLEVSPTSLAE